MSWEAAQKLTKSEQFTVRDQREPGWFFVDNELVDKYGARLGAYGVAIYAVLCRHCKNSTQQVTNLSQRDIAATVGISQDRVRKSLSDLAGCGLIHMEVPNRPSPGIISTITLLKVKATERHTFSGAAELNATRSRNKEVKTKTETETSPPLSPPLFADQQRAQSWAEKNGYAYRAFCRALEQNARASIGVYQPDHKAATLKAAFNAGVPERIALALTYSDEEPKSCEQEKLKGGEAP